MKGEICGSKTGKRHTCGPWHCTSTFGAQLLPCGRAGSLHPERASAFGRRLLCTASPSQLAQTRPEPARRTLPAMAQSRAAQPPPQRGSASGPASPHSSPQARSWIKRAPPRTDSEAPAAFSPHRPWPVATGPQRLARSLWPLPRAQVANPDTEPAQLLPETQASSV